MAKHLTFAELEQGLAAAAPSPANDGVLRMIVRRPDLGRREVIDEGRLDVDAGLVGDNWRTRGSTKTADGTAHPEMQINLMNARVIDLIAQDRARWPLAGDQLFIDFDLSESNVPPGTRLTIGSAELEVTPVPHLGCQKFIARFGVDAVKFVNSPEGRRQHRRGINAKVVKAGVIRAGDVVRKIPLSREPL